MAQLGDRLMLWGVLCDKLGSRGLSEAERLPHSSSGVSASVRTLGHIHCSQELFLPAPRC